MRHLSLLRGRRLARANWRGHGRRVAMARRRHASQGRQPPRLPGHRQRCDGRHDGHAAAGSGRGLSRTTNRTREKRMADTQQFTGKAAIVTGAGQGIGEGYAKGLASRGCAVVVADINETQGRRVADEIGKAGGKALFAKVDVASEASAKALAEQTVAAFGRVDYLVNNAAMIGNLDFNPLMSVDLAYLNQLISVNMLGAVVMKIGRAHV